MKEKIAITLSSEILRIVNEKAEAEHGGNVSRCINNVLESSLLPASVGVLPPRDIRNDALVRIAQVFTPTETLDMEIVLKAHRLKDRQDKLVALIIKGIIEGSIKLPE